MHIKFSHNKLFTELESGKHLRSYELIGRKPFHLAPSYYYYDAWSLEKNAIGLDSCQFFFLVMYYYGACDLEKCNRDSTPTEK